MEREGRGGSGGIPPLVDVALLCLEQDGGEARDPGCSGKQMPRLGPRWKEGRGAAQEGDRGEGGNMGAGLIWGAHFDSGAV